MPQKEVKDYSVTENRGVLDPGVDKLLLVLQALRHSADLNNSFYAYAQEGKGGDVEESFNSSNQTDIKNYFLVGKHTIQRFLGISSMGVGTAPDFYRDVHEYILVTDEDYKTGSPRVVIVAPQGSLEQVANECFEKGILGEFRGEEFIRDDRLILATYGVLTKRKEDRYWDGDEIFVNVDGGRMPVSVIGFEGLYKPIEVFLGRDLSRQSMIIDENFAIDRFWQLFALGMGGPLRNAAPVPFHGAVEYLKQMVSETDLDILQRLGSCFSSVFEKAKENLKEDNKSLNEIIIANSINKWIQESVIDAEKGRTPDYHHIHPKVTSGKRTILHHDTTSSRSEVKDVVVAEFPISYNGLVAKGTRTLFLENPSEEEELLYDFLCDVYNEGLYRMNRAVKDYNKQIRKNPCLEGQHLLTISQMMKEQFEKGIRKYTRDKLIEGDSDRFVLGNSFTIGSLEAAAFFDYGVKEARLKDHKSQNIINILRAELLPNLSFTVNVSLRDNKSSRMYEIGDSFVFHSYTNDNETEYKLECVTEGFSPERENITLKH